MMDRFICAVFVIFMIFTFSTVENTAYNGTLKMLHVLYRHGDRAPISFQKNDPYKDKVKEIWPNGAAQLTEDGKRMEYNLGWWLRQRYTNFVGPKFDPDEINIVSTDVDRTLMSAQCVLAAFFYPDNKTRFIDHLEWIPAPIHAPPLDSDKLLNVDGTCPRITREVNNLNSLPKIKDFYGKHKDLFNFLTKETKEDIKLVSQVGFIYDTIMIEKYKNLTLPSWVDEYYDEMKEVSAFSFVMNTFTHELKRLRGGPLTRLITDNMNLKMHGKLPDKKLLMFSGHDVTVSTLLDTMGLYEKDQPPPYAATVLVELHDINGQPYVKAFYQNDSTITEKPYQLALKGCTHVCPLDKWSQILHDVIPKDWDHECYRPDPYRDHIYIMTLTGLSSILGAILMFLGALHLYRTKGLGRFASAGYEPLTHVVAKPDYGALDQRENSINWSKQPRSL